LPEGFRFESPQAQATAKSEGSSGAAPHLEEEKMWRRVLRANSPCTTAAEEEMREAGAREGCETTRGFGGVLTRNNG
jgi:hypothetical protein